MQFATVKIHMADLGSMCRNLYRLRIEFVYQSEPKLSLELRPAYESDPKTRSNHAFYKLGLSNNRRIERPFARLSTCMYFNCKIMFYGPLKRNLYHTKFPSNTY